jgi:hypothetical protein
VKVLATLLAGATLLTLPPPVDARAEAPTADDPGGAVAASRRAAVVARASRGGAPADPAAAVEGPAPAGPVTATGALAPWLGRVAQARLRGQVDRERQRRERAERAQATAEAPAAAATPVPGPEGGTGTVTTTDAEPTGIAARVAGCESSGDPRAKNPSSSASGLYQFIDSTWERASGLPAPARAHSAEVQTRVFWKLWNDGAGAGNWAPSRHCWA